MAVINLKNKGAKVALAIAVGSLLVVLGIGLGVYALKVTDKNLLVTQISVLLANSDLVKDFLVALLSSLLAFLIAWFTIWYQDKSRANSKNISTLNEWVLSAESAASDLISLKQNYFNVLEDGEGVGDSRKSHPFFRFLIIPRISIRGPSIEPPNKMSDLVFITNALPPGNVIEQNSWLNIPRLGMWRTNYFTALSIWQKRNEELDKYLPFLTTLNAFSFGIEQLQQKAMENIGVENIEMLIDLTEQAIHISDILIRESNEIMMQLPDLVEPAFKGPRGGEKLIKFESMTPIRKRYSHKVAPVDYDKLAAITGRDETELRQRYQFWDH